MAIKLANPLDHTSVQLCFAFHRQAVVISGLLTKDSQQSKDVEERNISTGPGKSCVSGQRFVKDDKYPHDESKCFYLDISRYFLIVSVQPVITQSVRPRAGSLSEEDEEVEEKKRYNPRQDQYHLQPHG